jgi:AcrR family transcriptional regulator
VRELEKLQNRKAGKPKRSRSSAKAQKEARAKSGISDRRKLRGMVSRDRILDSALELFSQRGYAATGVYDIARAAKIEKTALYWHFGSKEGLLAAVLDRMDEQFVERSARRVARTGDDSDTRLDVFVDGLMRIVTETSYLLRLMLSVSIERSQESAETRAAMLRILERTRLAIGLGFEDTLGVKVPDIDLIARLCLGYLYEAAVREQIDPGSVDHPRFFAHLRRLIALDVEHQLQRGRIEIVPERRFKRR